MNWIIIGPGNGLSLVWCQAITRTNAGHIGVKFESEFYHFKVMQLKMPSVLMAAILSRADELKK